MSIELVMPSNHLIFCGPLLFLPSIFGSIKVLSHELALHIRWPKYWRFSFSISPSNEHLGLISFRMDWLVLLAVQGTLKSLLQHCSSKASILQCSVFFFFPSFLYSPTLRSTQFMVSQRVGHDWATSLSFFLSLLYPRCFRQDLTHSICSVYIWYTLNNLMNKYGIWFFLSKCTTWSFNSASLAEIPHVALCVFQSCLL